ncbi:MAG: divergent PAP2 family protein [Kiritimatiellae bacterium]|nr:divergent PAP2 family protein [Kiritimatiellia bacterium]
MTFFAYGIIKSWQDLNAFEIIRHPWFISAFLAGGLAQLIKLATVYFRTRKVDAKQLAAAGGMPSAHTSLVTALAVAVGLTDGFNSPEAMITVGLATITMVDAISIRHEAGKHAELLNRIVARLNEQERFEAARLRERLGHRRREVVAGLLFGTAVTLVVCGFWDFWK